MPLQVTQPRQKQRFSESLGNAVNAYGQLSSQRAEDTALQRQLGVDLSKISDPQTRQTLITDALKFGRAQKQAAGSQNVQYGPEGQQSQQGQPGVRERAQEFLNEQQPRQKFEAPEFMGRKSQTEKFFPTNKGDQEAVGNAAQQQTTGKYKPVLDRDQLLQEGQRIAQQQSAQGIPTNALEGFNIAKSLNDENKLYNQEVDIDTDKRVVTQQKYGKIAEEKLVKLMPNATDEQRALFKRKGEEAAQRSTSEANIERELSKEAVKFKNNIANIKKSIEPRRLFTAAKQDILGTDRKAEKARDDINIKLQPLLKEGLYDTARDLLSELGYHPEERESIITDLGEGPRKALAEMPKIEVKNQANLKKGYPSIEREPLTGAQQSIIKNNMTKAFKSDRDLNLVLLRKAYEDKGVDWRDFKDTLNEMMLDGEIELNDDQFNHLDLMDTPPLNNLDKILHGLKMIGR